MASILFLLFLPLFIQTAYSCRLCSDDMHGYEQCADLRRNLNSKLFFSHNVTNSSLSILFIAAPPSPDGWIAWGINPSWEGMIGAEAIVAYKDNTAMTIKTVYMKSYAEIIYQKLSFELWGLKAEQDGGGVISLFANMKVPENAKSINHTWQIGKSVKEGKIVKHGSASENHNAKGRLNLSGHTLANCTAIIAYEISNILGWTIFYFIALIVEKMVDLYPSLHPTWWSFIHVVFKLPGFGIGAYNSGLGIILGSQLTQFSGFGNWGAIIFCIATALMISELFIMPGNGHRNRSRWNCWHNRFGYLIMLIGVVHVYKGNKVFDPEERWLPIYAAVVSFLFLVAFILEFKTCTSGRNRDTTSSSP